MREVSQPGRYTGRCVEHKVAKTKNGFFQFIGRLIVTEHQPEGGKRYSLEGPEGITAYLPLSGRNGINYRQVESLSKAFGIDGPLSDFVRTLSTKDVSEIEVSVVVSEEEYEGKQVCRVQWINSVGGLKPLTEGEIHTLNDGWEQLCAAAPQREPMGGMPQDDDVPF